MSKELENIFKEKFENFEAKPSSDLFDKIQSKRNKKRGGWIWTAAAFVLISSATVGGFVYFNSELQDSDHTETVKVLTEPEMQNVEKSTSLPHPDEISQSDSETDQMVPSYIDLNSDNQKLNNGQTVSNKNDRVHSNTDPSISLTNDTNAEVQSRGENTKIVNQKLADLYKAIVAKEQAEKVRRSKTNSSSTKGNVIEVDHSNKNNIENHTDIAVINADRIEDNTDSQNDLDAETNENNVPLPIHKLVKLSKWSIELTAGAGYADRLLSGESSYITLRNESETPQISYMADLRAVYELSPKWNVQLGLNALRRNESFEYKLPNTTVTKERQETRTETVIHPVLGSYEREYTVTITETKEVEGETVTADNTFTFVNIPLAFERNLISRNNLTLTARAGVSAGIFSSANGYFLVSIADIAELNENEHKTWGIHTVNLGLGALYTVSDRLTLVAYPQINFGLNSSFADQYILTQKHVSALGTIGIRVRL